MFVITRFTSTNTIDTWPSVINFLTTKSRLCHSKTRGRDMTSSPYTCVDKQKLSVAHYPDFAGNFKIDFFVRRDFGRTTRRTRYSDRRTRVNYRTCGSVSSGWNRVEIRSVPVLSLVLYVSLFNIAIPRISTFSRIVADFYRVSRLRRSGPWLRRDK